MNLTRRVELRLLLATNSALGDELALHDRARVVELEACQAR